MRSKIALLLVLAFLTALTAPVRTAWACPNGTVCVRGGQGGYTCAGDRCETRSCCAVKRTCECKHGDLPGLGRRPSGEHIGLPESCRFSLSAHPDLRAVPTTAVSSLLIPAPALPVPALPVFAAPAGARVAYSEYNADCGPPPFCPSAPSRAPPSA